MCVFLDAFGNKKSRPSWNLFRTNSICPRYHLIYCHAVTLQSHLWNLSRLSRGLRIPYSLPFSSQLVKCYSGRFTLQRSHHPLLSGNDKLPYFSSSSLMRLLYSRFFPIVKDFYTLKCYHEILNWIFSFSCQNCPIVLIILRDHNISPSNCWFNEVEFFIYYIASPYRFFESS